MRVLIVNFEYPPLGGGGGVATRDLAEALVKENEVEIVTTHYKDLPKYEETNGVKIYRVPVCGRTDLQTASMISLVTFVLTSGWWIWKITGERKYDVINAQFVLPSGVSAAIVSKLRKIPLVVSFIGGDLYDPSKGTSPHRHWWLRLLVRMISRQAVMSTAISEDTKKRAEELHGVKLPIKVIPLGIKPPFDMVGDNRRAKHENKMVTFVSVGRLIPRKGYEKLLRAWTKIKSANLVIIGDGPLRDNLGEQISAYGLNSKVDLKGCVSDKDKWKILLAADGYVSAATHEGFGIVFLEAMMAGLPIIAIAEGGHLDFLEDKINAILVADEDEEALVKAVEQVAQDKAMRERIKNNNLNKVKQFYLEKTSKQFEEVLIKAIERKTL